MFLIPSMVFAWRVIEGHSAPMGFAAITASLLVAGLVAGIGYAVGISLPPAADLSLGSSFAIGTATGSVFTLGAAHSGLPVPLLPALYVILAGGGTWLGKRLVGTRLEEDLPRKFDFDLRKMRKSINRGKSR